MAKRCFVIMPFSATTGKHTGSYWDDFFHKFVKPSIENLGYSCSRSKAQPSNIINDILKELLGADLVLAVLTDFNANVWYELGTRHALRKGTIMMIEEGEKLPFDISQYGVIKYEDTIAGASDFKEELRSFIHKIEVDQPADSPAIDFLGSKTRIKIEQFLQVNLQIVHETILIVVGTSIGAERYDRVFAQLIQRILRGYNNIEAAIITDVLYHRDIEEFKSNPIICIGSHGTNSLVNQYEKEFDLKDRETTAKVFTDGQRPIAFIYGGGVRETYDALIVFCKEKMIDFVEQWSTLYTRGRKKVEIPSNIEDLLKRVVSTMSDLGDN